MGSPSLTESGEQLGWAVAGGEEKASQLASLWCLDRQSPEAELYSSYLTPCHWSGFLTLVPSLTLQHQRFTSWGGSQSRGFTGLILNYGCTKCAKNLIVTDCDLTCDIDQNTWVNCWNHRNNMIYIKKQSGKHNCSRLEQCVDITWPNKTACKLRSNQQRGGGTVQVEWQGVRWQSKLFKVCCTWLSGVSKYWDMARPSLAIWILHINIAISMWIGWIVQLYRRPSLGDSTVLSDADNIILQLLCMLFLEAQDSDSAID
jgi:hypothetical protein